MFSTHRGSEFYFLIGWRRHDAHECACVWLCTHNPGQPPDGKATHNTRVTEPFSLYQFVFIVLPLLFSVRRLGLFPTHRAPSWPRSYTLAAQADALSATMDGPVGVNSDLRGHNTSQYDTWEPGIGIYHRPGRGESGQSCCGGDQLALCGAEPAR
jgi:hypothetical protein